MIHISSMNLPPGIYIIHNVSSDTVLDWCGNKLFQGHPVNPDRQIYQRWYVRRHCGGLGYEIRNIRSYRYLCVEGKTLRSYCQHGATVWALEHQFEDVYSISILGSRIRMWCPDIKENSWRRIHLSERDVGDSCLWKFEKISDQTVEEPDLPQLRLRPPNSMETPNRSRTVCASGTYRIYNRSGWALDWKDYNRMECMERNKENQSWWAQQWYVRREGQGYEIQNKSVSGYLRANEKALQTHCRHAATVWHLEHEYEKTYSISVLGSRVHIWCPNTENGGVHVHLSEREPGDGCFWKFEKISDECGESDPLELISHPQDAIVANILLQTNKLFNMPRAPFTPIQRMAVLDWARKLGIPNVPTMESLEEYERTEARRNNNSHPDGQE